MTTTIAASERGRMAQTVKTSIQAVAAAVALATGTALCATPDADARPRKEVEDARTSCVSKPSGKWQKNGVLGYICEYRTGDYEIQQWVDTQGGFGQICYRLDAGAPWTCN